MNNTEFSEKSISNKKPYKVSATEILHLTGILVKSIKKLGLQITAKEMLSNIQGFKWIRFNDLNILSSIFESNSRRSCNSIT